MPTTKVAIINGATKVLTKRKKIVPKRSISSPTIGNVIPTSIPKSIAVKIHKESFLRLNEITNKKIIPTILKIEFTLKTPKVEVVKIKIKSVKYNTK